MITKLLSLLMVAVCITQACNKRVMPRVPNYSCMTSPKKILDIPKAHGICIAANGNFAVVSWNTAGKVYMYRNSGQLIKIVDLGYRYSGDCIFTDQYLYVTDFYGKKVHQLTTDGKFVKVFATGQHFFHMASHLNHLYFTTSRGGNNVLIYNNNGAVVRSLMIPGESRGVIVGIDNKLYVCNRANPKAVYTFTLDGNKVGIKDYKELDFPDGIAMDSAGNLIVTDFRPGKLVVRTLCGAAIKTIHTGGIASDVEIASDGTMIVADWQNSKVYFY